MPADPPPDGSSSSINPGLLFGVCIEYIVLVEIAAKVLVIPLSWLSNLEEQNEVNQMLKELPLFIGKENLTKVELNKFKCANVYIIEMIIKKLDKNVTILNSEKFHLLKSNQYKERAEFFINKSMRNKHIQGFFSEMSLLSYHFPSYGYWKHI